MIEVEESDFEPINSKSERSEDELDMTPMVDVTFLLLIFFMITAAFALQKSLEIPKAEDDTAASVATVDDMEKDSLVVRIDADNVFWIGAPTWEEEQRAPSKADMRAKVRDAKEKGGLGTKPLSKMLVQANGDSTHEYVVAALDAGSGAGMEEISLMVYEEGDL